MIELVILVVVGLSAFSAATALRPIARKIGLVDYPGGRKSHAFPTPLVGGLFVYVGTLVGFLLSWPPSEFLLMLMFYCGLLLGLGVLDDMLNVKPFYRLTVEILLTSGMLLMFPGLNIESLILFGFEWSLGGLSVLFTTIFVVGLINAFNLIDGIDGLAAVSFALSLTVVGSFSLNNVASVSGLFVSCVVFSLMVFLVKNLSTRAHRKVLLGDSGCLMLGGVVAMLSLKLLDSEESMGLPWLSNLIVWALALPLLDMVAVLFGRIRSHKHPFQPDRTHIHHLLVDGGVSQLRSLVILTLAMAALMCVGLMLYQLDPEIGLSVFVLFAVPYVVWRNDWISQYLIWRLRH